MTSVRLAVPILLASSLLGGGATAHARTVRGLVYVDADGDGAPGAGERGVANAVVGYDVAQFVVTDAHGLFTLEVADDARGIAWVRVPDGFAPGPVWAPDTGQDGSLDLGVRPLPAPHAGPVTFVVAADTHVTAAQPFFGDLAAVVHDATALEPRPAFFTILGDVTQGNRAGEFDLVDLGLAQLEVPYAPVPGNHDWYDGGAMWRARYGPDNYSFDLGDVHFVVWNMAMSEQDIARYLGAELARVAPEMTIVALTHAPPSPAVVRVLDQLGVDYLLTGHTHSNRVVDHGGLLEITTEPLMMGGLDFTPAGYRVVTLDRGRLTSYHRAVVDRPLLEVIAPARGQCVPAADGALVAALELDASAATVTARLDCGTELGLRFAGGWSWRAELPPLAPGAHTATVTARAASGAHATRTVGFEVCAPPPAPPPGPGWPQLGGSAAHTGAVARELAPPLVARWTTSVGGHVHLGGPVIAGDRVYVAASDLGDGGSGGIVALELATGAIRWRTATPVPVRGGPAVVGEVVIATQLDGTVLGLDARDGSIRWRHELGAGLDARAAAVFAAPAVDGGELLIGNQRRLVALSPTTGTAMWARDPVGASEDFVSMAAVAVDDGVAVGVFNRELGGVSGFDRDTGHRRWHLEGEHALSINASPVIADGLVYLVNGATSVLALELATGVARWHTRLDPLGFDWAIATIGTPALARGILVVPTLWRDLVALDAQSGLERWRFAGRVGPLRTTHYRGTHEAGFEASPVITGDVVWAADTSGRLTALDLHTGQALWSTELGVPVLAGLATSGAWLVVASYDGTVRALTTTPRERPVVRPARCEVPATRGCCDARGEPTGAALLAAIVIGAWRRRRPAAG